MRQNQIHIQQELKYWKILFSLPFSLFSLLFVWTMTADKSDFIAAVKQEYLHQGVILTTKRSKPSRVELKCDLGGSYTHSTEAQDWLDVLSRSFVPVSKVNGQSEKSLETTTILLVAICEVILLLDD